MAEWFMETVPRLPFSENPEVNHFTPRNLLLRDSFCSRVRFLVFTFCFYCLFLSQSTGLLHFHSCNCRRGSDYDVLYKYQHLSSSTGGLIIHSVRRICGLAAMDKGV
jgi:hypothetical protein